MVSLLDSRIEYLRRRNSYPKLRDFPLWSDAFTPVHDHSALHVVANIRHLGIGFETEAASTSGEEPGATVIGTIFQNVSNAISVVWAYISPAWCRGVGMHICGVMQHDTQDNPTPWVISEIP